MGPLEKDGALSTDLSVQRFTQLMRAPFARKLMTIPVILIRYKYKIIYMFPTDMDSSSLPKICNRRQHLLIQMLLYWMEPGVSLTIIALP